MPRRFIYLLGRIGDKDEQELVTRCGVSALIDKDRTECLDPFLSALNEETFLSQELESIAIHEVFSRAPQCQDDRALLVKCFFDHPAISTEDYSIALYHSYEYGGQAKELFLWLLKRADHQDLEVVKKDKEFLTRGLGFNWL